MSDTALDVDEFMDRVQQDKELFFELLDIFVSDYHGKRRALEEAIDGNDAESIEHVAHFLKGSCGNISAHSLGVLFSQLEVKGKDNDIVDARDYLPKIDQNFDALLAYIGELRKTIA